MRSGRLMIHVVVVASLLLFGLLSAALAEDVPRMSTEELKGLLGDTDLTVLDVRTDWDWNQASEKIVGAQRAEPRTVQEWAGNYPKDRRLVLYCA